MYDTFLPHNTVLRRFAVTQFLLELQFWFPVWLLFLTDRGFDLATIVIADGLFRFTMVVFEVPMGIFGDWIGHKRAYLIIALLAVVTYTGIVFIETVPMVMGMWILWGIFWAMSSGAASAYGYELTVQEGYGDQSLSVFGSLRAVTNFAALLSHLLAGFVFNYWAAAPFAISAFLALVALFIILTLPDVRESKEKVKQSHLKLSNAFGLLDHPIGALITIFLMAIALIYYWSPRILMQPLFIEMSLPAVWVSGVYFMYSLAGIIAGISAARVSRYFNTHRAALLGMVLVWLGISLIAILPGYIVLWCFPLLGFGYFITYTVLEVDLHQRVGNSNRATVLSAVSFIGGVIIIFARPGLGLLADKFTAKAAFGIWGLLGVIMLGLFVILQKRTVST